MKNKRLVVLLLGLTAPALAGAPRVAVVIDDFGLTYKANPSDDVWMKLDEPLTFAVMPDYKITTSTAKRALLRSAAVGSAT